MCERERVCVGVNSPICLLRLCSAGVIGLIAHIIRLHTGICSQLIQISVLPKNYQKSELEKHVFSLKPIDLSFTFLDFTLHAIRFGFQTRF